MDDTRSHRWLRDKLEGYALGLASPNVAAEVEAHVRTCEDCQRRLEALRPDAPLEGLGEHLPYNYIADWESRKDELQGVERELIRRHLERCDACRQLLEFNGHPAVLPMVAALEPGAAAIHLHDRGADRTRELESYGGKLSSASPRVPSSRPPPLPAWPHARILSGVLVGALATAAAFVLMWPSVRSELPVRPVPPPPSAPPKGSVATPQSPSPAATARTAFTSLRSVRLTEFTADLLRSAESGTPDTTLTATVGPGDSEIYLRLEAPEDRPSSPIRVRITDPRGNADVDLALPPTAFHGDRLFVYERPGGFRAGLYRIVLTPTSGPGQSRRYSLRIQSR